MSAPRSQWPINFLFAVTPVACEDNQRLINHSRQYNHIFEDNHDATFTTTVRGLPPTFVERTGGDTDMILGRLNYRFGGPVVGRY
jgi:hypothetical protein